MSDVIDELKRLTPIPVDRDKYLTRMAQAAVPQRWAGWKWLCVVLAISQTATLVALWVRTRPFPSVIPNDNSFPSPISESSPASAPEQYSYAALCHVDWEQPRFVNAISPERMNDPPILRIGQRSIDD